MLTEKFKKNSGASHLEKLGSHKLEPWKEPWRGAAIYLTNNGNGKEVQYDRPPEHTPQLLFLK